MLGISTFLSACTFNQGNLFVPTPPPTDTPSRSIQYSPSPSQTPSLSPIPQTTTNNDLESLDLRLNALDQNKLEVDNSLDDQPLSID